MAPRRKNAGQVARVESPIRFGTSGWRAIIADEFTFKNLRLAAQGIADHLCAELKDRTSTIYGRKPGVILGHDTRFMGDRFTEAVAEVLAANGLTPLLCDRDAPTPVIAHAIRARRAIGGINMTASHNPAEYQGLKFSPHNGAAAPPEITGRIEANIVKLLEEGWSFKAAEEPGKFRRIDPRPAYIKQLRKLVDFATIKKAKMKIAVELMYGTGRGYLDTLLEESGVEVTRFHDETNPGFGGRHPEPNAEGMAAVSAFVRSGKAQMGLGLDGDADRFGIVDKDGTWITPNQVLALVLYHLKKNRGWTGSVVRTVPTSHQVDSVAGLLGVPVHETPVGFKYIGAKMESEAVIVGGEESGGLSVKGHVPEKDGILACLLLAELVATEGKSLGQVLKRLEKRTGQEFHTDRINVAVPEKAKAGLLERLKKGADRIGKSQVLEFITTDGFKFILPNNEWVAYRASGTEPVFRCYIEAKSEKRLARLREDAKKLLEV